MKKILLTAGFVACSIAGFAQMRGAFGNRGSFHIFTNLTADYHINNFDVKQDADAPKDVLTSKNKIGTRIGFDAVRITKHRIYFHMGFDFRFEPQVLAFRYDAKQMGFSNSSFVYEEEQKFTNRNIVLRRGIMLWIWCWVLGFVCR